MSKHDWHRPEENNPYMDVVCASLPPQYKWTCSKCGEVTYRKCSDGEPDEEGCKVGPTNYGKYFSYGDMLDQYQQTADTLVQILEAPGMFMLEVGIDEEDLELRDPAVNKIEEWLQKRDSYVK